MILVLYDFSTPEAPPPSEFRFSSSFLKKDKDSDKDSISLS